MRTLQYAIVFVSDMTRSVAFYRDVLGLPLRFESPGWSELANEGTTIALHASSAGRGEPASAEDRPGTCRLGFQVEDLDATHRQLLERDVTCLSAPKAQAYGIRQAVYADPDGLTFTLAQRMARG